MQRVVEQSQDQGRVREGFSQVEPLRALGHPAFLVALAVLVLNDHSLKGSGVLPGWFTGKLSDFAGLLVAPAVLIALAGLRSRRSVAWAHAAVGLGLAAIKLFPAAAGFVETTMANTLTPWHIVVDPTDLLALPMLWQQSSIRTVPGGRSPRRFPTASMPTPNMWTHVSARVFFEMTPSI